MAWRLPKSSGQLFGERHQQIDVSKDAGRDDWDGDGRGGDGISDMSVFDRAKKLVSDGLHVPVSAIEIIVRG